MGLIRNSVREIIPAGSAMGLFPFFVPSDVFPFFTREGGFL
jgi:hypothetical protein